MYAQCWIECIFSVLFYPFLTLLWIVYLVDGVRVNNTLSTSVYGLSSLGCIWVAYSCSYYIYQLYIIKRCVFRGNNICVRVLYCFVFCNKCILCLLCNWIYLFVLVQIWHLHYNDIGISMWSDMLPICYCVSLLFPAFMTLPIFLPLQLASLGPWPPLSPTLHALLYIQLLFLPHSLLLPF